MDRLAFAVTMACLVGAAVVALRGRALAIVVTIEALLAGLAAVDLIGIVAGHRPAEPTTHVAYVVTAVLVLPLAAARTRRDGGVWARALLAVAMGICAVLVVRMMATGR